MSEGEGEIAELAYEASRVGDRLVAVVAVEGSVVVVNGIDDNETSGDDSARRLEEKHAANPCAWCARASARRRPARPASAPVGPTRDICAHLALDDVPDEGE